MRKFFLCVALMCATGFQCVFPCGGYSDEDLWNSSKLYNDSIVGDESFSEFLYSYYPYQTEKQLGSENCRLWAKKLGVTESQAYYLVNTASATTLDSLLKIGKSDCKELTFADKAFCKKNKKSLLYLAHAKYLEPYMSREETMDDWELWRYHYDERRIDALEYDVVIENLKSAYDAQNDNELKLRYGYQLVRFAHYKRQYADAVRFFDSCVEPLGLKNEIYYYALSQKAGAINANNNHCPECKRLGTNNQAIMDFLKVFSESKDLKYSAYMSLNFCDNGNALEKLYSIASQLSNKDAVNLYFILGKDNFNDGLAELSKIVKLDPNAVQARVLMSRFISGKSRYFYNYDFKSHIKGDAAAERAKSICEGQIIAASDKEFWTLSLACLNAYSHEFAQARNNFARVNSSNSIARKMKREFTAYLDICEPDTVTEASFNEIFTKNQEAMDCYYLRTLLSNRLGTSLPAERFFLTNDYAGPETEVLEKAAALLQKTNKTPFEKWAANQRSVESVSELLVDSYMANGEIPSAARIIKRDTSHYHVKYALAHLIEWPVLEKKETENPFRMDYVGDVMTSSFESVTYYDFVQSLNKVYEMAQGSGDKAAKAAYLMGNLYHNLGRNGYYRYKGPFQGSDEFARKFYTKALSLAADPELRAHILYGLSLSIQEGFDYYVNNRDFTSTYFQQLKQLNKTDYYDKVVSKCYYFEAYVNGAY